MHRPEFKIGLPGVGSKGIYDIETGKLGHRILMFQDVVNLYLNADGTKLVMQRSDGSLELWRTGSFGPDGWAVASSGGS
ncbi:MAG: hypothetical protein KDB00_16100 [Planctomycetales bacterium]|nr:hypothetical protein [Planctomycetales bacterium]